MEQRNIARKIKARVSSVFPGVFPPSPEQKRAATVIDITFVDGASSPEERPHVFNIPQAEVAEYAMKSFEARDWRKYFTDKLSGRGLEIGPLHRPMVKHDGMQMEYVDRCSVAELRAHYPELNELPLVEPDVIDDAESLSSVADQTYDFLISAHVIEHMRNPLSSLEQWCRVVKPGGYIYMVVPDKRAIFDSRRVRTTLEHIILDYREPSQERDREHFLEFALHVNGRSGNDAVEEMRNLIKSDYSIHFHVFIPSDVVRMLEWFSANVRPLEIVEGPCMTPGSDEFHFLLKVGQ